MPPWWEPRDDCPVCGKQLKGYEAMKQHCRAVHEPYEYEGEFSDESDFDNDSDDDYGYQYSQQYSFHQIDYDCLAAHCSARFPSDVDRLNHMSLDHPCACTECGKECANPRGRAQHMLTVHGEDTQNLCPLQDALLASQDNEAKADAENARLKAQVAQLKRDLASERATVGTLKAQRDAVEANHVRIAGELAALRRSVAEKPKPPAVASPADRSASASDVPLDAARTAVSATSVMSLLGKTLALVPTLQKKAHEASNTSGRASSDSVSFTANPFLADQAVAQLRQKKRKEGVAMLDSFLAAAAMFLGLSSLDAVLQSDDFELLYHGTDTQAAKQILKFGFDPGERSRQAYGVGEYFCTDLTVASNYTNDGIVVVSIVLEDDRWMDQCTAQFPSVRKVHNPPRHAGTTFCLPLGVIGADPATASIRQGLDASLAKLIGHGSNGSALSDVPKPEMTGRFGGPISARLVDPNARADKYYFVLPFGKIHGRAKGQARLYTLKYRGDNDTFVAADADYTNAVALAAQFVWMLPPGSGFSRLVARETLVTITANRFKYEVDLVRMSQRNLQTDKVRDIAVDVTF